MISIKKAATLPGHQHPIYAVCNSQKQHIFFTGGSESTVVEWSLRTMQHVKTMFKANGSIYALHSPESRNLLLCGDRSGMISIFDFDKQEVVSRLIDHAKSVFDIQSSGNYFYSASEDGKINQWALDDFTKVNEINVSDDTVRVMAISPDGRYLAAGCRDSKIKVYECEGLKHLHTLEGHKMAVFSLIFSPDGKNLISGSRDAQIKVWNMHDFSLRANLPAHLFAVNSLSFHPEGKFFASGSMDKSIKIWNIEDLKLYKIIDHGHGAGHRLSVNKLTWNSFNNVLISVSDDHMVMVWDVDLNLNLQA